MKDGNIDFPDDSDIIRRLAEVGFVAELEQTELAIEISNTLTETELNTLEQVHAYPQSCRC